MSESSEEKELVKKRGGYKGRLTMFSNYLVQLEVTSMTEADMNELQLRISKLEELFQLYDDTQSQLEYIGDLTTQLKERSDFESTYYKLISKAQAILTKIKLRSMTGHLLLVLLVGQKVILSNCLLLNYLNLVVHMIIGWNFATPLLALYTII